MGKRKSKVEEGWPGRSLDASFGVIHTEDLLTTSHNLGYAMKVIDKAQTIGVIVGEALGNLNSETGVIPVMVTLK